MTAERQFSPGIKMSPFLEVNRTTQLSMCHWVQVDFYLSDSKGHDLSIRVWTQDTTEQQGRQGWGLGGRENDVGEHEGRAVSLGKKAG